MTTPADGNPSNYRFADLTLDVARRSVARNGQPIELKALDFDLLRFLVEQAPNVVNADVLAEKVWGRHFVSPENVAQRVMLLRQSLSDDANRPRYIETLRNKGYRLIPVVERVPAEASVPVARRRWLVPATAALLGAVGLAAAAMYWLAGSADQQPPNPSSVAVLPFENLSPDADDAFFAASMQDEIVSQLTKISGLRVIPVRLTGDAQNLIPDVARDLNVATALGGSVYYSEGRVRVTPRLTEAATGVSLWSDSYERELRDIFVIQSEIALDVADKLRLELSDSERQRIERVPTVDPRAFDLYLRAMAREYRDTPEESLRAISELEEAVALDPEFTEAWRVESNMHNTAVYYDPENAGEHQARGEQAARRALQLDPELGGAHAALGYALSLKKDWKGAEAAYRKARSLNVPLGDMSAYSILQLSVGNFAFAREILEETRAAEPQNAIAHRFLMFANAGLGESATATALYESGMRVFVPWREGPTLWMHWLIGRKEFAAARAVPIDDPLNLAMLASLDAPEDALAELRDAYAVAGAGNPLQRRNIALWAAHFGDAALALDAMRAAIDEQGGYIVHVWLPQLAPLRELPAFKAYLREIGIVDYWKEYGWPDICRPLGKDDFKCD